MKTKSKMILGFFIIFCLLLSLKVLAKTIYDMQRINVNVEKPISKFRIEYEDSDGEIKEASSNSKYYDSGIYEFDLMPNEITVKYGTKIKIFDESTNGSGSKISMYDFQIYTPSNNELINTSDRNAVEKEMILDESGEYNFYLSVMDDYKNVAGFDNWSINGNHRWLGENVKNREQLFYWYFSQLRVIVLPEGEDIEEIIEPIKEDEEEEEKEEDEENRNPEVEILVPDELYPLEITSKGIRTNIINWYYFDEDKDKMKESGYELYKVVNKKKILIDSKDGLEKIKDCFAVLEGEMNDKFILSVYVIDEEDNIGRDEKEILINEFMPSLSMNCNDRCYLNDKLAINFKLIKDNDVENNLVVNYLKNYIYLNDKLICSSVGKFDEELLISDKLFEENKTYELVQEISNSYGRVKKLSKLLFVVPIEKPLLYMNGISLYYGESKNTDLKIFQPQSKLKSYLEDYIYEFSDEDGWYELYYNNELIKNGDGFVYEFIADETNNIKDYGEEKLYKLFQYAKNDRGKVGMTNINILVKPRPNDYIDLKIIPQDDDDSTISNEIYKGENICFKTEYSVKEKIINRDGFILDEDGNAMYENKDLLNNLIKIDLTEGKYKAVSLIQTENTLIKDEEYFTVKKIEKPVIMKRGEINYELTRLDNIDFLFEVTDINRSEEHPNGFELYNNFEINNDKYDEIYSLNDLSKYLPDKEYLITQYAVNAEHNEIKNEDTIEFYLKNLLPNISANNFDEYGIGDEIFFDIKATDNDGYISRFEITNDDLSFDVINIKNNVEWIKRISFTKRENGIVTFNVLAEDNDGGIRKEQIQIIINGEEGYPFIKIIDEDKNRMKINRYIQIEYGCNDEYESQLYFNGINELINYDSNGIYENEFVKMILEEKDSKYIAGLYFKKPGNYSFVCIGKKDDIYTKERKIELQIQDDMLPIITIKAEEEIYRDSDSKRARANIKMDVKTDDEIDYTKVYSNDSEIELNDSFITFDYNELGLKNVKAFVKEAHSFLPNETHPFYNELVSKMKSSYSNEIIINIVNIKPELSYKTKNEKKYTIIE